MAPLADVPLFDFPVPVPLEGPLAQAGLDLRFATAEHVELIFTREGDDLAWVFVPELAAAGTEFFAYFDNSDAALPEGPNPWQDYLLVLHGDTEEDASGTNEVSEATVSFTDGLAGRALSFDGDGDILMFEPNDAVAGLLERGFTASMWVRTDSNPQGAEHPRLIDHADGTDATSGWSVMLSPGDNGPADFLRIDLGRDAVERRVHLPSAPLDVWAHIAFTVQGDDVLLALYDGVPVPSTVPVAGAGTSLSDASNPLTIGGSFYSDIRDYLGEIDELRLTGMRTEDRLIAEYAVHQPGAVESGELEVWPPR